MTVKVLKSGSSGNGYVIEQNNEYLLLECGVDTREFLKAINFETSKVAGCLVSHVHNDHAAYVKKYSKYGFPIFASREVSEDISGKSGFKIFGVRRNTSFSVGNFKAVAFSVPHNETECDGFLISHPGFGKLLFMTDLEYCPYNFAGQKINHLMIECNYAKENVDVNAENYNHVFLGHMEVQTCKQFIRSILHPGLSTVGLIHPSRDNINPYAVKLEMEQEFIEQSFWIADAGTEIYLGG